MGRLKLLLCERKEALRTVVQDNKLHHPFDVSPEMFNKACKVFHELGSRFASLSTIAQAAFYR
jgi:hypothetical protein